MSTKTDDDRLTWKTISSEYLFKDNWLKARKNKCVRPDGKVVYPYYVMEYPDWVTALGLTKEGDVILVRQYRHALGEVCLEIPGGCVDKTDKNLEEAIRREFLEETGYGFETALYLGRSSANPSTNNNTLHMFLLTGGEKVQNQELDPNEEIDILVVGFEALKQMLFENQFVQSMHVTTIFYALTALNKLHVD